MAKKQGLMLSKAEVEKILSEKFKWNGDTKGLNSGIRYFIDFEGNNTYIDIYYRSDNTITPRPEDKLSVDVKSEILEALISESHNNGEELPKTNFSVDISSEIFQELVDYLNDEETPVILGSKEDKGANGIICHAKTDYGDKAVITYYPTTSKLRFQGNMFSIYIEVRNFLSVFIERLPETVNEKSESAMFELDEAASVIEQNMPQYYQYCLTNNGIILDLIKDSVVLSILHKNISLLSDYSPLVMPICKALEYRIKEVAGNYGIMISSKDNLGKVFQYNKKTGQHEVVSKVDLDIMSKKVLLDMYGQLKINRNVNFHMEQEIVFHQPLSYNDSQSIISEMMTLLEKANSLPKT